MLESPTKPLLRIFISYRRTNSSNHAGRLFSELCNHFDEKQIFFDVEKINPGEDFVQVLEAALSSCGVLIALIDESWPTIEDENGRRRLDDPEDYVRIEIATALRRKITVIPVLLGSARMPSPRQLPPNLKLLSRRQALELSDRQYYRKHDVELLVRSINQALIQHSDALEKEQARQQKGADQDKSKESASGESVSNRLIIFLNAIVMILLVGLPIFLGETFGLTEAPNFQFVEIPAGQLSIGSTNQAHRKQVTFAGFEMGQFEVTQNQWRAIMRDDTSLPPENNDLPMVNVSWDDAQKFIDRLNFDVGESYYVYSLPSETEWEYACWAGEQAKDQGSNLDRVAWYKNYQFGFGDTHSIEETVSNKAPNKWKLFNMHGNVWEWCEDQFHENYGDAPADGRSWTSQKNDQRRVLRGGAYDTDANSCACNFRYGEYSNRKNVSSGFRLVRRVRRQGWPSI
jgi:formylglycine-generating enzyme required for sulfatase activity